MTLSRKILLWDTKIEDHIEEYEKLESMGVELDRVPDIAQIKDKDITTFAGLIAHPGLDLQTYFLRVIRNYSSLKTAIVSEGPGDYRIAQDNIAILRPDAHDLNEYFFGKTITFKKT